MIFAVAREPANRSRRRVRVTEGYVVDTVCIEVAVGDQAPDDPVVQNVVVEVAAQALT